MKDLSVICVNYNSAEITAACLDSVFAHTSGLDFELILADNASVDASRGRFSGDPRITYLYSEENLGFGRANNLALASASGRNILFLNTDTLLRDNALKTLSDYLDAHPAVGAVGPNLVDADGRPGQSFMRFYPSLWAEFDTFWDGLPSRLRYGERRFFNSGSQPLEVAVISGAALCVRRSVLEAVGAFDPDFFMYFEDTELCHRIGAAGWKLVNLPSVRIVHLGGASSGNLATHAMKTRSWKIYLSKTRPPRCASFLLLCRKCTVLSRIALHSFRGRLRRKWKSYWRELQ